MKMKISYIALIINALVWFYGWHLADVANLPPIKWFTVLIGGVLTLAIVKIDEDFG